MSVGQNPFDSILQSLQQNGQSGPQTPSPAPAAPAQPPASPLAALPGYNDAIAQQASSFVQDNLGKTPRDYMLKAMGITPDQEKDKTTKDKTLHRLGVLGQILGGRNFTQEGQQNYSAVQQQMTQSINEMRNQQLAQQAMASLNAANYYKGIAATQKDQALAEKTQRDQALSRIQQQQADIKQKIATGQITAQQAAAHLNDIKAANLDANGGLQGYYGFLHRLANGDDPSKVANDFKAYEMGEAAKVLGKPIKIGQTNSSSHLETPDGRIINSSTSTPQYAAPGMQLIKQLGLPGGQPGPAPTPQVGPALPGNAPAVPPTPYGAPPASIQPSPAPQAAPAGLPQAPMNGQPQGAPMAPAGLAHGVMHAAQSQSPTAGMVPKFDPLNNRTDWLVSQVASDSKNMNLLNGHRDKYLLEQRMRQLGLDPNNVSGSQRERAANAKLILDHLGSINDLIDQADKQGDMGIVATRWNDFLNHKLGDDPTQGKVFSKLSSELGFLTTAAAMAHGGLRGGGSPQMVEHWEKTLEAKDPATLKSKLSALEDWMKGYSSLVPNPSSVQPASASANKGPSVGAVEDGYRFKGGDPSNAASWEKVK